MKTTLAVIVTGTFLVLQAQGAASQSLETLSKESWTSFEEQARSPDPAKTSQAVESVEGVAAGPEQKKAAKPAKPVKSSSRWGISFDVRDWKACLDWMSMDIDVIVDGERFSFNPSCSFSFSRGFKTKKGVQCRVEAGMCSSFYPENAFEVRCDGGLRGEIGIPCKDSGDDGVLIEPDWESCVDGWNTMSVRVTVEDEHFEFHPSCDWQFSERFQTKAGGSCYAESGMCTSWHPKNRFEVVCEKGQEGFVTIPCRSR